jgi:hypothetical protein
MSFFASFEPGLTFAAGQRTARFTIGSNVYEVDGTRVSMTVAPCIISSRIFLPIRYIAEAVGISETNVKWDPVTQKVTIAGGGDTVEFTIGSKTMKKNDLYVQMDVAPINLNGRVMIPVKWAAEGLNAKIDWDPNSNAVTITSNITGEQEEPEFKLEELVWEYQAQSSPCKVRLLSDGSVSAVEGSLSGLSWDMDGNIPVFKKDGAILCRFTVLIPWQSCMMFLGEYEPNKNITCILREIK